MKKIYVSVFMVCLLFSTIAYGQLFGTVSEPKKHHTEAGISCVDCHDTDDPIDGVEEAKCLTCHESRDKVAELTKSLEPNPHFGHEEGLACKSCHKEHEESVLFCDDCHKWGYVTP